MSSGGAAVVPRASVFEHAARCPECGFIAACTSDSRRAARLIADSLLDAHDEETHGFGSPIEEQPR